MHMRGNPSTMQNRENLKYELVETAELCGVPMWRIVLDPGIGFSKKAKDNLDILMGLKRIRCKNRRIMWCACVEDRS
ncbi:putative Pterin-binding domain, dihydropteroate synthase [Helianthus annuus]|nr:putative Pterin-binding domain, dihydropteroate synthase [Helianthus annuus]